MRVFCHLPLALMLCVQPLLHAQKVAITFDDLPAHGDMPPGTTRQQVADSILATLQQQRVPKVYGFINAQSVQDEPETLGVLQAWHNAGFPLGNHTWSHPDLSTTSAEEFLADVDKNEAILQRFDHSGDTRWFRYPFLHEGNTVEKHRAVRAGLAARGYKIAEVTMDFEDYLWNDPYARCMATGDTAALQYLHDSYLQVAAQYITIDRDIARRLFGKDLPYVLLMHLGAFDAKMLPELLALYRSQGFQFIEMPKALKDKRYHTDPDYGDPDGGSYTEMLMSVRDMDSAEKDKPYQKLEGLCPEGAAAVHDK